MDKLPVTCRHREIERCSKLFFESVQAAGTLNLQSLMGATEVTH